MKKQSGITLIALIITIIVMLILVGVTINVALNGGLFNTADDATTKTEKHAIYDQIVGAMKLNNNGNIKVKETFDDIVDMFGEDKINPTTVEEDSTEVIFTVIGKRGTYTYKITGTEIEIIEGTILTKEKLVQDLQSKAVGEKYTLNSIEYVIVAKDETTAKLMPTSTMGSVTLGAGDTTVTGTTELEKAINSYNNSINKLNAECKRVVGYETLPTDVKEIISVESTSLGGNNAGRAGTFSGNYGNEPEINWILDNNIDVSKTAWLGNRCAELSLGSCEYFGLASTAGIAPTNGSPGWRYGTQSLVNVGSYGNWISVYSILTVGEKDVLSDGNKKISEITDWTVAEDKTLAVLPILTVTV